MHIIDDVRESVKQFINSELELNDNETLFDIGINSINYIELIIKLEKKYNIEFSDEYLLNDSQTINSLAQYLVDKLYEKNIKK